MALPLEKQFLKYLSASGDLMQTGPDDWKTQPYKSNDGKRRYKFLIHANRGPDLQTITSLDFTFVNNPTGKSYGKKGPRQGAIMS